ncbi:MAG: acyl carrier protein [Coleofasciculaceae cyanobacterium]
MAAVEQNKLNTEMIQTWLQTQVAEQLGVEVDEIDIDERLDNFGLDSAQAMIIMSKSEKVMGFELSPTLLWHYPTIESLAERLAEEAVNLDAELLEKAGDENLAQMLTEIEQLSPSEVEQAVATQKQQI